MQAQLRIFISVILILISEQVSADSPLFGALNADDGIPGFAVWDIKQDATGYLWIATVAGLARYDGYSVKQYPASDDDNTLPDSITRVLHIDADQNLWVGTDRGGLALQLDDGSFQSFQHDPQNANSLSSNRVMSIASSQKDKLWVGTDNGLNLLNLETNKFERFISRPEDQNSLPNSTVRSLLVSTSGDLWVGTYAGLAVFDPARRVFKTIELGDEPLTIVSLFEDSDGSIWIGALDKLLKMNPRTLQISQPIEPISDKTIIRIERNESGLWFGTLADGLFRLLDDGSLKNYSYHPGENSIAGNVILSLFTDRGGVMWIGTFNNALSTLNLNSLAFGRHDDSPGSVACMTSRTVYGLMPESNQILWLGTDNGVVKLNRETSECRRYERERENPSAIEGYVLSFLRASNNSVWVGTAFGLNLLDETTGLVNRLEGQTPTTGIQFIIDINPDELLLGTDDGLYRYDLIEKESTEVFSNEKLQGIAFNDYHKGKDGTYWFGTERGVVSLDTNGVLELLRHQGRPTISSEVRSVHVTAEDLVWAGVSNQGLWKLDRSGQVLRKYNATDNFPVDMSIGGIQRDQFNNLWVGTQSGITKIDANGDVVRTYTVQDGLQGNFFNAGPASAAFNGELFFGGRRGFNAFYPEDIVDNNMSPSVVLTELRLDNNVISPNERYKEFELDDAINHVAKISLKHQHKMFSIDFAALDYADVGRNQYAYKLDGFDDDWNYTNADQRRATYTNLNPGLYTFQVRASNKDGIWNNEGKSLTIRVVPAPWATWWARTIYMVLLLGTLLTIYRVRNASQRRRAVQLESEVALRTLEVEQQKTTIEHILARKNSLFENVSHEFRTPLTLLIGPLKKVRKKLINKELEPDLELALVNANRLLLMVDQLLNLAEISKDKELEKSPRTIAPTLHMLIASFAIAAKQNSVELQLDPVPSVSVNVTNDALEIVIGNLISNAIKYVGVGGKITISTRSVLDQVEITVKDDGPGIDPELIEFVFDRFARLPQHLTMPGTGLGLAVSKEVVEANGGTITCTSEQGNGATFTVTLPTCHTTSEIDVVSTNITLPLAEHLETDYKQLAFDDPDDDNDDKPSILVIDDNIEILGYIRSVIAPDFKFIGATNGKEGIQLAQSVVPDLIICDVMMPEIDGFEVSNALRSDHCTSHIPIILLTARGDRSSRLRGWQESVDEYVQKPFDEEELRSRISNLLSIRKLLSEKLGNQITEGETLETAKLCESDQVFLEKLTETIEQQYGDVEFARKQMASIMAVSERQLQRKLKSIIDRNPADFLREYRLNKAKDFLIEGRPVNLVVEDCGFSSHSYFTKCFREKFGMPPKKYQTQAVQKGRES